MSLDNWGSGKIIESKEYGTHINLTCKNHLDKRWSTKNIAPIGCRKIFYNLDAVARMGQECDCPMNELIPVWKD